MTIGLNFLNKLKRSKDIKKDLQKIYVLVTVWYSTDSPEIGSIRFYIKNCKMNSFLCKLLNKPSKSPPVNMLQWCFEVLGRTFTGSNSSINIMS